jgi:NADH-ubiquinone/plastoquinone oxidoreductase chain 6
VSFWLLVIQIRRSGNAFLDDATFHVSFPISVSNSVSGIIGLIFWWEMFFILDNETIPLLPTQRNTTSLRYMVYAEKVQSWTNLETLGNLLYTHYFVWFLVSSLILLVAMIGAIVLTMQRRTRVKRQEIFRRNALDSRRTIMKEEDDIPTHDPYSEWSLPALVRFQFVRPEEGAQRKTLRAWRPLS